MPNVVIVECMNCDTGHDIRIHTHKQTHKETQI